MEEDEEEEEEEGANDEEELIEEHEGYSFGKLRTAEAPLISKAARS